MSMEILDGNPPEEDELFSEKLKKVTPEEVEQLAQKVFKNDDHLIIILEEAERIDKEEDSKGSLVKLKEELQSNEKLQAKAKEISKKLKESGKEKINTTDSDSVNGKTRQGSHAIMNCQVSTDKKHGINSKQRSR